MTSNDDYFVRNFGKNRNPLNCTRKLHTRNFFPDVTPKRTPFAVNMTRTHATSLPFSRDSECFGHLTAEHVHIFNQSRIKWSSLDQFPVTSNNDRKKRIYFYEGCVLRVFRPHPHSCVCVLCVFRPHPHSCVCMLCVFRPHPHSCVCMLCVFRLHPHSCVCMLCVFRPHPHSCVSSHYLIMVVSQEERQLRIFLDWYGSFVALHRFNCSLCIMSEAMIHCEQELSMKTSHVIWCIACKMKIAGCWASSSVHELCSSTSEFSLKSVGS